MAKYKVLAEVEVLGEARAVGSELEIDAETAAPFVADGNLEEVKEETPNTAAPAAPETSQPSTPENAASTPAQPKHEKDEWAGNHTVDRPGDK